MSPLARSLLALAAAALLHAACAEPLDRRGKLPESSDTYILPSIHITLPNSKIKIPDNINNKDVAESKPVGQDIVSNRREGSEADVRLDSPPSLDYVVVASSDGILNPDIDMSVTRYTDWLVRTSEESGGYGDDNWWDEVYDK